MSLQIGYTEDQQEGLYPGYTRRVLHLLGFPIPCNMQVTEICLPRSWECTRFLFQELACLCANDRTPEVSKQPPLFLIDNTGWKEGIMTGSAASTRLFAGIQGSLSVAVSYRGHGVLGIWERR